MTTGAEIARRFFEQAVRAIVEEVMPGVGYLAGRLGSGSDVLGFDDTTSADHDYGCRLTILVDDRHRAALPGLDVALSERLPDEVTAGPVFHDSTEGHGSIRRTLTWYPDDVWFHVLAAGWARLGQELPFVGRCGQVGDDVGSAIITSRLCRDIAHLTFLTNRAWMPYPKWAGTALTRLPGGGEISDLLAHPERRARCTAVYGLG